MIHAIMFPSVVIFHRTHINWLNLHFFILNIILASDNFFEDIPFYCKEVQMNIRSRIQKVMLKQFV